MKTKAIYYEQDYRQPWETKIIGIERYKKDYGIRLAQSAFYPGGGGQPCDLGWIHGIQVKEVWTEGDEIIHLMDQPLDEGERVVCQVDGIRRLDLMQQHSGQHLLSAVFYTLFGGQTSSFHLGLDYVTIDISIPDLSQEVIEKAENQANQYIFENLPIQHYLVNQEKLKKLPLRKQPQVEEDIRIVEIEGVDWSPCGGTHLAHTGEIGLLKIIKTENYKGNTRVYFKAGGRALEDFQHKSRVFAQLTARLSSGEEELVDRVEKELEKARILSKDLNRWKEKAAFWETKDLIANREDTLIARLFEDKDFQEIERISKEIHAQGEYLLLFGSQADQKLLLSHSGHASLHCGKLFREALPSFGGRGGGNDKKAQAAFSTMEGLEKFYQHIKEQIRPEA